MDRCHVMQKSLPLLAGRFRVHCRYKQRGVRGDWSLHVWMEHRLEKVDRIRPISRLNQTTDILPLVKESLTFDMVRWVGNIL